MWETRWSHALGLDTEGAQQGLWPLPELFRLVQQIQCFCREHLYGLVMTLAWSPAGPTTLVDQ